jgi:hypothetical protein
MEKGKITKAQQSLLSMSKIIETECAGDANTLLRDGFVFQNLLVGFYHLNASCGQ